MEDIHRIGVQATWSKAADVVFNAEARSSRRLQERLTESDRAGDRRREPAKAASAEAYPRYGGEREQRRPATRIRTPATGAYGDRL